MSDKINLIECFNYAWQQKCSKSTEELKEEFLNQILPSYMNLYQLYTETLGNHGESYNNEIFVYYTVIFMKMMMSDGEFLVGEYEFFQAFSEACGYDALAPETLMKRAVSVEKETYDNMISTFKQCRDAIGNEEYKQFIVALSFLALSGDKELDEEEFNCIISFLDEKKDVYPKTIKELKETWK